jgi:hypothetical protein
LCDKGHIHIWQIDRGWCSSNITMVLFSFQRWKWWIVNKQNTLKLNTILNRDVNGKSFWNLKRPRFLFYWIKLMFHYTTWCWTWWQFVNVFITCALSTVIMALIWNNLWRLKRNTNNDGLVFNKDSIHMLVEIWP